ncbi:MAG: hypothetical protein ABL957_12245 [Parvularculaceae bacterium]
MSEENKKAVRGRLKRAIAKTAPALAEALGGPLAGKAVEKIARAIFGSGGADEAALEEALKTASADQLIALKRAEAEFAAAMRNADVEEERIAAGDRASARARQTALDDFTPAALGALIVGGFFIVLAVMVARELPEGAQTEFSIMLGALATMTAAVVNYYFGSSAGSREKTRLLASSADEREAK